jgi:hypothetical protein
MDVLTTNPRVLILIDPATGERLRSATNVSNDLFINVTENPNYFNEQAKGLPFDTDNPLVQTQVLASKH